MDIWSLVLKGIQPASHGNQVVNRTLWSAAEICSTAAVVVVVVVVECCGHMLDSSHGRDIESNILQGLA
jgi:hypothetical protein